MNTPLNIFTKDFPEIAIREYPQYSTIQKLNTYVDWPSPGQVRWLIFKNEHGFTDKCVLKVGKRILIDMPKLIEWLYEAKDKN